VIGDARHEPTVSFRETFDCLWCGTSWTVRQADDLEGWARLCPTCLGKAGENPFLRRRLRAAIEQRAGARAADAPSADAAEPVAPDVAVASTREVGEAMDPSAEMVAYYEARAAEYDDWYLRRGRYEHGPIHDAAWAAELDAAGRWLDDLPLAGRIVELAAGTGWWSPLLAAKGELWAFDANPGPLDRARDRLVAHGLRAHLHVRDAWAEPDQPADVVFCGFWLSHVPRDRFAAFLALVRRWLPSGGRFVFIDSLADDSSGAIDNPAPVDDLAVRRLADGREFRIVKVFRGPAELTQALIEAGFQAPVVRSTGRFFVLGTASV
jgi:ubiquinone/menaquinone biosynthesis C-methylase UbiE